MSIADFNRGIDDACMGNCFRTNYRGCRDYIDGYEYGIDIEKKKDYEETMKREYEEHMRRQQEYYAHKQEGEENE